MAQIMRPRCSTGVGFKGASAERREQDSRPGASPSPAQSVASVAVYFFLEDTAPVFKMLQNLQRSPSPSLLSPTITITVSFRVDRCLSETRKPTRSPGLNEKSRPHNKKKNTICTYFGRL